ncbi:MAG: filamentous hemagglutinin family protein [Thiobacillaceae bacterium]
MNCNLYRLIFNAATDMFIPAAETARGRGKAASKSARTLSVLATLALAASVQAADPALPTGQQVKFGSINFSQSGNTLNINQSTQNGIIHWNSFNIGSGATVNFNQPNVTSATLNRITGSEASVIQGALNATGAVYVINRNGILFGKGAQVNLNTLVASTLDIKDDDLFKNGFLTATGAAFSDAYTQYVGTAPVGTVNVAEGAAITAASGGRVILLAPDVENKGIIKTDTGQIILAAGHKAYFHLTNVSDSSTLLRGLLVEVESGGSAVNLGELAAKQGDITLIGNLVKQQGVMTATSSVNLNGTIHLLARSIDPTKTTQLNSVDQPTANTTGQVVIGANSRTAILPNLDAGKVNAALSAGRLTQAQVDAYYRGDANAADFYTYMPDATLQDAQVFSPSQIKVEGHDVWVQSNAVLRAPSGAITLQARQDPSLLKPLLIDNTQGEVFSTSACADCRVQVDDGAVLDVSGLRDVALKMDRNIVEVELRGSVLADSPLLHDTAGPLYGKKIKVDIRDSATVDVNGQSVTRVGTTVADATPYIAAIGRKIDEKSTTAGTVNLYSEGALVVQKDAMIDLSGGSLAYQTGTISTSQLLYQGRLVDVATANPNLAYSALGPDHVVTEQGYSEGKNAGTLNLVAPWTVFQGGIDGGTVVGANQRGQGGGAPRPAGATLNIGVDVSANGSMVYKDYRTLNQVVFTSAAPAAAPGHGIALPTELSHSLMLDAASLAASNVNKLAVFSNNGIRVEAGQTLDMGINGSVTLAGSRIDVQGDIVTRGGPVSLSAARSVFNAVSDPKSAALAVEMGVDPATLDQHVSISGDILTAGLWSNDYLAHNAAAPLALNGGSISIASEGLIDLQAGSLLDASAGGWQKLDGKTVVAGRGGDITLTDKRALGATESLQLLGELRSFGLLDSAQKASAGGKLTISTLKAKIGGTPAATPSDAELWLSPDFFQHGGFGAYAITGANGLNVADDTLLAPRALTRVLDTHRLNSASGSGIAAFSKPTQLVLNAARAVRPAVSLELAATSSDYGNLRLGQNAQINLDPLAKLKLTAVRSLDVEGRIDAPGGNVTLELKTPNSSNGYAADAVIRLGAAASISAQGAVRTYTGSDGRLQGDVSNGGAITLLAHNGYIVAAPGSLLDVSGSQALLDLPRPDGAGYARTALASSGGSIRLAASEGLFFGGAMKAAGGSSIAPKGTLSVELDRADIPAPDQVAFDYLTAPRSIELYAGTPDFPSYLSTPGAAVADADNGRAALDAHTLEGFDHVNLKARDRIVFEQSLALNLRGRLSLDAPSIEVAGTSAVTLDALAISLGNADPLYQVAGAQTPTGGSGSLTAHAGLIDLIGNTVVSGAAQTTLASDGDLRLIGVIAPGDASLTPSGHFNTAGDLNLSAAQVYPTTLSEYTLESSKPDGRIAIHSNGAAASTPLAAGGAVTLRADYIDQAGVLRAPLGKITLDANKTLTLFDKSLTSVSADGLLIPYGRVVNGQSWVYDLNVGTTVSQRTVFSGADGVVNLPSKDVLLRGDTVVQRAGARVDLSGGGDLYGYEFSPGPGGSSDYLATPGVYAILPASAAQPAPFDFQYSQYGYASATGAGAVVGRELGTGASQQVKPGDSVYLSAIPSLNIAAGYYTLLPAHYALLPGAVAIRAVANTTDMSAAQNTQRSDGSYLVAGHTASLGATDTGAARWSGFELAPRDVVTSRAGFESQYSAEQLKAQTPSGRSEIHDYFASQLIPSIASLYDLALPKFGPDAGRLGVEATTSLTLDGAINYAHASGTRGGELDIASSRIAVTDGSAPQVANPEDYLVLDVDLLASYGVDSLMLGGTREAIVDSNGHTRIDQVKVNQVAQDILIQTDAAHPLQAPEVMLVGAKITLADNAVVRGAGAGGLSNETLVFGDEGVAGSGDGVLIRASSGGLRGVVRRAISSDGGDPANGLYTGSNAVIYGEKSVNLDATSTAFNLGTVSLGDNAGLQLGARRVALGQVDHVVEGVFVTNALLQALGNPRDVVLKSYSNFDIYGDASLGSVAAHSLSFEGAGFASLLPGQFNVAAETVRFGNPDGSVLKDVAAAVGGDSMNVLADTIEFGAGQIKAAGFNAVNLTARGEIAGVAQDAGTLADGSDPHDGLTTGGNLTLSAQRITGYNGSDVALSADGVLTTAHYTAATGETVPTLADAPLGGKLSLEGASVIHGGDIELAAGALAITATTGKLELLSGSRIFTGGVIRKFKGVNDIVDVPVAGGSTTLVAQASDIVIEQGATVDVSGQGGADAGRLDIRVPAGRFELGGQLLGTVVANAAVPHPWQGSFKLDAMLLDDGDAASTNDFSALLQHLDGFGESFNLRQRSGDLTIAADDTLTANRVNLSVDNGVLDIAGTINAQATAGGSVVAAAGQELYLRSNATIDAQATGANQRGGEVWLMSGMNRDYVAEGDSNGALVLENGSTIQVGGTLASSVEFNSNTPGGENIVLTQTTGGRVHLQAPRIGSGAGTDVRITHKAIDDAGVFASDDAIGASITGAALIEALGNKVFDYTSIGATQTTAIKNDSQTFMNSAATAKTRLGGDAIGTSAAFQVRPGVEVRSDSDLTFAGDYDLGAITAVSQNQPGVLTLRAAGRLLVNGNLSDGFNSATGSTLDAGESWSYRLAAGADLSAADPLAVQNNLDAGTGDFVLKGGKLIRTGTGSIQIAAGGDVRIGAADGSYNRASVIYTAGRVDGNPAAAKPASDAQFKKVDGVDVRAFGVDGGALGIVAAGSIVAPEFGQLTTNWLQRRGTIDSAGGITLSPAWVVVYEYFNQGVGALGGGNVLVEAGRDISNLAVSLPTTGRDYAVAGAGSKLFETGGGSADVHAEGDIRGSFVYVQKGAGRVAAGGVIGAMQASELDPDTADNRNLVLAMGDSRIDVYARNGLALETAFNPTVAAVATGSKAKSISNTDFFTYSADSAVSLVSAQRDILLSNSSNSVSNTLMLADLGELGFAGESLAAHFVYPGSLTAAALDGSLTIGEGFALYPSAQGQLHLLAHDDVAIAGKVNMSDVDPARLPTVRTPATRDFIAANELLFNIQGTAEYHAPNPTHLGDADPVRIYAETGSIEYIPEGSGDLNTLYFPKPAEFIAGHDIRDVSFTAQHVAAGQTSTVWAGRDVTYKPLRNGGALANNGSGIQIDGPGYLDVVAGRNIDLGSTGGIITNGNLHNPALPVGGANIALLAGMGVDADGRPRQPDYVSFATKYLVAGGAALSDFAASVEDFEIRRVALLQLENAALSYADVQGKLKDPAYRASMKALAAPDIALALTAFNALPQDVQARRIFYHELEMAGREANQGLGYARADQAIAAFFPNKDAAGNAIVYSGGYRGFFSQVRTNQGGNLELLTPGGSVDVGLVNNPDDLAGLRKASDLGLFTVNGGSIDAYSRDSFSVNTSRVFTLGQEKKALRTTDAERLMRDDILLFSLLGDIDAGKGAKTASAAPPPSYEYDSKGNLTVNLSNSISGSGIGVLLAREVIVPGDVSLIAPTGSVNAGDAGIRALGNLNIAAAHVIGTDNIAVAGLAVGVPASVDTGGLSVSGVAGPGDAAKAAGDATGGLSKDSAAAQKAADEMKKNLAGFKPSLISVEVLGFGEGEAECAQGDDNCRKQKKNGS